MKTDKQTKKPLLIAFTLLLTLIITLTLIGIWQLQPTPTCLQGEVEATLTRVSGKVPGRILEIRVTEGQTVHKGDTLAILESPEVEAKLQQALAAQHAAESQSQKVQSGTRQEQITAAYEIRQKALTGTNLAKKTYTRIQNLYDKNVLPAQKRDEAEAAYQAALATSRAAESHYQMALNGAQSQDKQTAQAMVDRAKGAVSEVTAYNNEKILIAPTSGEISDIFPGEGELVGPGAPILHILKLDNPWIIFNIPEELLSKLPMGTTLTVNIPALNNQPINIKITYIKAMASYATQKATKPTGGYDAKTFEIKAHPTTPIQNLRPGMTVLLDPKNIQ